MKVAIIGGGISGLALAWNFKQKGIDCTLYEKEGRTGGWIRTSQKEGFIFEQGPHSCRTRGTGRETLELIEQLGLEKEVVSASPAARQRFIYTQGQFKKVPVCPVSMLLSPWNTKLLKALWNDWKTPQGDGKDEAIYDFVSRRLSREVAEELFDPFTTGIYAGDIRKLSIQACFPFLASLESNHGGLVRGFWAQRKEKKKKSSPFVQQLLKSSLFSFKEGMQTLTDRLQEKLHDRVQVNKELLHLERTGSRWKLRFADGEVAEADRIFLTVPAHTAAKWLTEELAHIPYASVSVVNLGYKTKVLPKEGFGYLIPSKEKDPIMGVLWDSSVFPQQNRHSEETRLTVMMRPSTKDPVQEAQSALARHLRILNNPDAIEVSLAHHAIPQYEVGHLERLKQIESRLPSNISLLGSSYRTISVNDCIAEALNIQL